MLSYSLIRNTRLDAPVTANRHLWSLATETKTPTNAKRDGKFRQIQVSVKGRPDVTVRARSGYFAPTADAPVAPPSEDKLNPDVRAALDSPFGMPSLPMRMASLDGYRAHGGNQPQQQKQPDSEPRGP